MRNEMQVEATVKYLRSVLAFAQSPAYPYPDTRQDNIDDIEGQLVIFEQELYELRLGKPKATILPFRFPPRHAP
jgi:hypothetical protein